jgi:hypothetical protein
VARTSDRRSTSNGNAAGSSYNRRARKQWLLDHFGDGVEAKCVLACSPACEVTVTIASIWVDRIVPGCEGGTYARGNIQPSCGPCNMSHGGRLGAARRVAKYGR